MNRAPRLFASSAVGIKAQRAVIEKQGSRRRWAASRRRGFVRIMCALESVDESPNLCKPPSECTTWRQKLGPREGVSASTDEDRTYLCR